MNKISGFSLELSVFDWAIVVILALSTLMSLRRGFVREAFSLGTWIAAFIVSRQFHDSMDQLLEAQIQDDLIRSIGAFAALFVGTLLVGAAVSYIIGVLIHVTGLSATDRILGMVFGFSRGAMIVTLVVALIGLTPLEEDSWYTDARLVPHFEVVAQWALEKLLASGLTSPMS